MGLFDGVSLKSVIRDVTNVVGAFTGAEPIQTQQPTTVIEAPQTSPGWIPGQSPIENLYDQRTDYFGRVLPGILSTLPVFNQKQPATEINISIPSETKESGQMENGPQVYQGAAGALVPFAQQLGRTIFGGGAGGAIGGAIGGALIQQGVQQFMGGDSCGCGPKAFVRLDKCGRPIITRNMQRKAKEMVMCMGIENAAAALGISVPLLAEIAFKKFKPRAKGISGAQLKTAKRVNNQVMNMAKQLKKACK